MPRGVRKYKQSPSLEKSEEEWFELLLLKISGKADVIVPFAECASYRILDPAYKGVVNVTAPVLVNALKVRLMNLMEHHTKDTMVANRHLLRKSSQDARTGEHLIRHKESRLRDALIAANVRKLSLEVVGFYKGAEKTDTLECMVPAGAP